MKNLLIVLFLVAAVVVGLGFYLGWFNASSDSGEYKPNLTLTVDPDKIQDDKKKVLEKVHDLGDKVKGKATTPTEQSKD